MQVALNLETPPLPFSSVNPNAKNSRKLPLPRKFTTSTIGARGLRSSSLKLKASAAAVFETVDYSSTFSVFPAEACETIGGDACLAVMCPEAKLQTKGTRASASPIRDSEQELVDRDYLQYDDPKTVLLGEACDALGGEFCESPVSDRNLLVVGVAG